MSNPFITPYLGEDGNPIPAHGVLIAGKNGSNLKNITTDSSGNLNIAVASQQATTGTESNVVSSASNVTILSSNSSRKGCVIYNDSTQILYVKFGSTASATSFTYYIRAGGTLEFPQPIYTGQVDGIWGSANGNARVTEIT